MIGIYKITNKNDGKIYIGQSNNCERRIKEHQQQKTIPIDMWINMLGKENFDFEIIEECQESELDEKEQNYIAYYDSIQNGYNQQIGGFNNSSGEGNGRAKIAQEDVIKIRQAYANHKSCKETYKDFEDRISYSHFQGIWQGRSWTSVMPEVFTEENKAYYVKEINKTSASLTNKEVLRYRKYYMNHTRDQVYQLMCEEKGKGFLKARTFEKILIGDVRENSVYNEIPIYKKSLKQWFFKGEPVSTIPESGEQECY